MASSAVTTDKHSDQQVQGRETPASLLTIPQELRDEIYELLLVNKQRTIDFSFGLNRNPVFRPTYWKGYIALSATCRQLHHEIVAYFFGSHTFATWVRSPLPSGLTDHAARHMKDFRIYGYGMRFSYHRPEETRDGWTFRVSDGIGAFYIGAGVDDRCREMRVVQDLSEHAQGVVTSFSKAYASESGLTGKIAEDLRQALLDVAHLRLWPSRSI